eukprot:4133223-Alexandrium_andersonii.AAC.1
MPRLEAKSFARLQKETRGLRRPSSQRQAAHPLQAQSLRGAPHAPQRSGARRCVRLHPRQ